MPPCLTAHSDTTCPPVSLHTLTPHALLSHCTPHASLSHCTPHTPCLTALHILPVSLHTTYPLSHCTPHTPCLTAHHIPPVSLHTLRLEVLFFIHRFVYFRFLPLFVFWHCLSTSATPVSLTERILCLQPLLSPSLNASCAFSHSCLPH